MRGEPLARDHLETMGCAFSPRGFHDLAGYAKVNVVGKLRAQLVTAFARVFYAHIRINSKE